MPNITFPHPRFALASRFDARRWTGHDLFKRGDGDPVAMPAFDLGEGLYEDALAFLHGYGSGRAFGARVAPYAISFSLTSDDRIRILNTGIANATLQASPFNAWWGLPTIATVIPLGGGTLTGSNEWRRGLVWSGLSATPPRLTFTVTGQLGSFRCPPEPSIMQNIIIGLRERGEEEDLDDKGLITLEDLDNATNDATDLSIRWGITDEGHVYWSSTHPDCEEGITWLSDTLRRRLGFSGLETVYTDDPGGIEGGISSGYLCFSIADKPLPGFITPTRPLHVQDPYQEEEGDQKRLTNGSWASHSIGSFRGYDIEFFLDGPDDTVDLHREYLLLRQTYCRLGEPLTLFQDWGDSRRALEAYHVDVLQPAYDLLYTSDRNGYRGRVRCRLSATTGRAEAAWDGDFRRRAPVQLSLDFAEEDE